MPKLGVCIYADLDIYKLLIRIRCFGVISLSIFTKKDSLVNILYLGCFEINQIHIEREIVILKYIFSYYQDDNG